MAARRTSRFAVKPSEDDRFLSLKLKDVLCPICRSILIEPVKLPCNHGFCLSCFNNTMANTNLVCPLCRIRISSWLRTANKEKKLVNIKLWKFIKETFPQQVNNKLNDIDENLEEVVNTVRLASPGALRREYEEQKRKDEIELQKQHETELQASEKLIEKLKAEDKQLQEIEEKTIKFDEEIAKKLSLDFNNRVLPGSSKCNVQKKQHCIDKFFTRNQSKRAQILLINEKNYITKEYKSKILCQDKKQIVHDYHSSDKIINIQKPIQCVSVRNSNNSIESECCYFKSIDHRNVPPSEGVRLVKIPTKLACASTVIIGAPKGEILFKHYAYSPFICLQISSSDKYSKQKFLPQNVSSATCIPPINIGVDKQFSSVKRKTSDMNEMSKKMKFDKISPINIPKNNIGQKSKCLINSPVFHGFDKKEIDESLNPVNICKLNGFLNNLQFEKANELKTEEIISRTIQEHEDFEIAKKLQDQLNQNDCRYYMRNKSNDIPQIKKRCSKQLTLDHMITQVLK